MADDPTVPWLLQPIAADDVGGKLHQRVKLSLGGDGAADFAPGDAANGLDVDVTRIGGIVDARQGVAGGAAVTSQATATAAVDAVAANANRRGLIIENDSTAKLRIKYGSGAAAGSFTVSLKSGGYWEMPLPIYTGVISMIWDVADAGGKAVITELT